MGEFTISQNGCADFTVLCNCFIDEYMAEANDAQLKVYLYLLRVVGSGRKTSISDLADFFNYTEKDILRALKYWEKKKVLALKFREDKSLESLQFLPLQSAERCNPEMQFSAAVPTPIPAVRLFTTMTDLQKETSIHSVEGSASAKEDFAVVKGENPVTASDPYEKPQYTLDQLKAFKAGDATSRLLFIAEQYLKKTLSPNEIKSIFFISDKLGFSEDLIDYLIQYCVGRDKKDFRYIEKVAINWAQSGITTPKQAAKYATKYDKIVYEIMNALGKNTMPTDAEMVFINRWTKEYGFDLSIIQIACDKTVLATDSHRFEYADKILGSWHKAGVRQKSDITKLEQSRKKTSTFPAKSQGAFNRIEQHDYDFAALEAELLGNS